MKGKLCLTLCKISLQTLKMRLILLIIIYINYNDQNYKECITRSKGALRILNLNCGGLNAKFDNLKIFLPECNNTSFPLHVITLQETQINSISDVRYFELPGYTLVCDLARINTFGGAAIYVHDSFSFNRLDTVAFTQNSTVYESLYLEIYNRIQVSISI